MLNPKLGYVGKYVGARTPTDAQHYYLCKSCGQAVDKRDLAAVLHHDVARHEPLSAECSVRLTRVTAMLKSLMEREKH